MSRFTRMHIGMSGHIVVRLLLAFCLTVGGLTILGLPVAAQGGDPAPDPRVAALEKDFLMGMVPHDRGAMMMSQMAVKQAARPEIRQLARMIIDSQQEEIKLMTNYLHDWYGMTPPTGSMMPKDIMDRMDNPMLRGMMPDMAARMQALMSKSGADFDIAWLSAMTDHNAMAIMMAAPVLMAAHHAALYDLAASIVVAHGTEIEQMKTMLNNFYGVSRALIHRPGNTQH